jgi:putative serine protease PepD
LPSRLERVRVRLQNVSPSVVQIGTSEGLGSGIVFDSAGNIVTNAHVVGTAKTFTVTTSSGKQLTGKLVGVFAPDDLAVIKVNGTGLQPAGSRTRQSAHRRHRHGDRQPARAVVESFTEGIVSALNRAEPEGNGVVLRTRSRRVRRSIPATPARALTDIGGSVIGIPTLAAADPQLGGAAAGIGFAIPSNEIVDIATQLVKTGKVTNSHRAFLGIEIGDTAEASGVVVTKILPGTAAAKAGLVVGDRITVSMEQTPTSTELCARRAEAGADGEGHRRPSGRPESHLSLTLGEYPGERARPERRLRRASWSAVDRRTARR